MERQKESKKFPKIEEMTKEQLKKTIFKKRETNAMAQKIVETLLEPGISEEVFINFLPNINQCHLDDIVEERAIVRICGYPVCSNTLSPDIPKQKFRISVKTNKVYDITARKKFCSNVCFKATSYIKKQMLTSPLWFREYEQVPNFQLMPPETTGSLGQELDLSIIKILKKEPSHTETMFTSINEFTNASFDEMNISAVQSTMEKLDINDERNNHSETIKCEVLHAKPTENCMPQLMTDQKIFNNEEQSKPFTTDTNKSQISSDLKKLKIDNIEERGLEKNENDPKQTHQDSRKKVQKQIGIIGDIVEKPEKKIDPIILLGCEEFKKSKKEVITETIIKKEDIVLKAIIHVEKCIAEWFTLDSMIFLFGEAKVKEMVADKGDCIKEYLNNMANGLFYSASSYDQYQQLCRKLNMLELEDHRYDSKIMSRDTKPLPDYSLLKEESKRMQLKVKGFLTGQYEICESAVIEEKEQPGQDSSNLTKLAPVDKNAQNALRRKILLRNLNRILQDIQRSLGIERISMESDVRLLVNSFKLKANNIMFKPIQWPLIGVVIIKLLSLRDVRIQQGLETAYTYQNLQLLMLSFKQDGGYLDRLVLWLTDIDRLLDTSDRQLTWAN